MTQLCTDNNYAAMQRDINKIIRKTPEMLKKTNYKLGIKDHKKKTWLKKLCR